MTKEVFQICLDPTIIEILRDKVNEQQNITINKKDGEQRAWDKICAIMDRLDDTVDYLNQIKLNTGRYSRSAFDFYDFLNNASVVVDCIKQLAKLFKVPDDKIKLSTNIFNQLGKDEQGTDERYFEYIRSLCSVHPIETSRHKRYQDNKFECSPYVMWNNELIGYDNDCDIYAVVYTNKDEDSFKRIKIYISQIFEYVKTRLEFVKDITDEIDQYQKAIIADFKQKTIKQESEFDTYIEYLKNLDKELNNRFGSERIYDFDYIIKLFELKLSNFENQQKMNLYLNALKYAIRFEHNSMQNMSYEGFENNGLIFAKNNLETSLYIELHSPNSRSSERKKYSYNLEKIYYLSYDSGENNKEWAYRQLRDAHSFLEEYVTFQGAQSDFEHYALVQLALYFDCLENKCLLNKNIPNELKYRRSLLSNEVWEDLVSYK
ncbi:MULTISPECIES: hypothetical protein [Bacillus cereus group]|uniref:hypothetical protein n=1 Tax=Bacillus cereus group TaxID=86661 RepID=UPI000CD93E09|nr:MULTISPECIES: hypothetical protein [Bacillus cereus group]QFQ28922.1 hypothetical protein DDE73_30485 [Bacillus thuringiensis]